jgi:uncharacterized damage-inducible protein DinB
MINAAAHDWVRYQQACFSRSVACLGESDSTYAPMEGMYTVAQHVAHTADIVQWLCDGAFTDQGFDPELEERARRIRQVTSLGSARELFDAAYDRASRIAGATPDEELRSCTVPPNEVVGEPPLLNVFRMMEDHTAHHRGALTVYSRLIGRTPGLYL